MIIIASICVCVRTAAVELKIKMKKWDIKGNASLPEHLWKRSGVQRI